MADKIFIGKVYEDRFALAKVVLTKEDVQKLSQLIENNEKVAILAKKSQQGKFYAEIDQYNLNK